MPDVNISYNEKDIIKLILEDLNKKMPGFNFNEKHLEVKVQSTQNYRVQEWEKGRLQITVDSTKIFAGGI